MPPLILVRLVLVRGDAQGEDLQFVLKDRVVVPEVRKRDRLAPACQAVEGFHGGGDLSLEVLARRLEVATLLACTECARGFHGSYRC